MVLSQFAAISDVALDEAYHYGLGTPGTFGAEANLAGATATVALAEMGERDIEKLAAISHAGWAVVARLFDDPIYKEKPAKRETRLKLANTPYEALPEEEKEKDRVAAKAVLASYL